MSPFQRVRAGSSYLTAQARRFFAAETRGMHEAAYLLAAFAFASQFLGLVRDRILAASFGAGHTLDLYYAAFLIPNFLFSTVASLLSLYALMPILSRLEEEKQGLMMSFLRDLTLVFIVAMTFISLIAYALAPLLAPLIGPGLVGTLASRADLVLLLRILLLQPILLGISNTISSLTQLRHRFVLYSISPLLYNLGIIFGAVELYPRFGIAGLGFGVMLGALMHMGIQLPFFFAQKSEGKVELPRFVKLTKEILTLSIPRTLALASNQISLLVIIALASFLAPGSIAIFNFAYNLQSVPLTIIGISYSVAAFPTFVTLYAKGAKEEFTRYAEAALRHIIFWSVPCMVFMIVLRAQIVRTILGAGQFNWDATRLTAAALALFIISLLAQCGTFLISRAYYAIGNTRKPFYIGLADIGISILSALGLLWFFNANEFFKNFVEALLRVNDIDGTSVLMLSLGYALGSIAEFVIGYFCFVHDFNVSHANFNRLFFESFAASLIGGAVSYVILSATGAVGTINTTVGIFTQGFGAGIVGIAVSIAMLWLLKSRELQEVLSALKRKFADAPQVVAVEPSDVA